MSSSLILYESFTLLVFVFTFSVLPADQSVFLRMWRRRRAEDEYREAPNTYK